MPPLASTRIPLQRSIYEVTRDQKSFTPSRKLVERGVCLPASALSKVASSCSSRLALLFGQSHRRFDHHAADQVARASATDRLHATAAHAELVSGLRFRRHGDRHLAFQRRYLQFRAERRLRKADRHFAVQVATFALEDLVLAHLHFDVEVAGRRTGGTGFALPGQADTVAVVDARGNPHGQGPRFLQAAFAMALLAGLLDRLAGAAGNAGRPAGSRRCRSACARDRGRRRSCMY